MRWTKRPRSLQIVMGRRSFPKACVENRRELAPARESERAKMAREVFSKRGWSSELELMDPGVHFRRYANVDHADQSRRTRWERGSTFVDRTFHVLPELSHPSNLTLERLQKELQRS